MLNVSKMNRCTHMAGKVTMAWHLADLNSLHGPACPNLSPVFFGSISVSNLSVSKTIPKFQKSDFF